MKIKVIITTMIAVLLLTGLSGYRSSTMRVTSMSRMYKNKPSYAPKHYTTTKVNTGSRRATTTYKTTSYKSNGERNRPGRLTNKRYTNSYKFQSNSIKYRPNTYSKGSFTIPKNRGADVPARVINRTVSIGGHRSWSGNTYYSTDTHLTMIWYWLILTDGSRMPISKVDYERSQEIK